MFKFFIRIPALKKSHHITETGNINTTVWAFRFACRLANKNNRSDCENTLLKDFITCILHDLFLSYYGTVLIGVLVLQALILEYVLECPLSPVPPRVPINRIQCKRTTSYYWAFKLKTCIFDQNLSRTIHY